MDDFSKAIDECLKILEENVDILADLEVDLEDEKENEILTTNVNNLTDFETVF